MAIDKAELRYLQASLRQTFDKISSDPMNLNLIMEHIANLTSAVHTLCESELSKS